MKADKSMNEKSYNESNKYESVKLNKFDKKYSKALLKADETIYDRANKAQALIDYLCGKYKIPTSRVIVADRKRKSYGSAQELGHYVHSIGSIYGTTITVFNLTAVRGEVVSIKRFYETLLHEFMHHYDYAVLKLDNSLHTSGFFKRIGDLKNKLE